MPETTGLIDKTAMSSMNVEIVKQLVDYFQGQTPQFTANPEAASQHTVFFWSYMSKNGACFVPLCLKHAQVIDIEKYCIYIICH